jgi:hypothetical protein
MLCSNMASGGRRLLQLLLLLLQAVHTSVYVLILSRDHNLRAWLSRCSCRRVLYESSTKLGGEAEEVDLASPAP